MCAWKTDNYAYGHDKVNNLQVELRTNMTLFQHPNFVFLCCVITLLFIKCSLSLAFKYEKMMYVEVKK